MIFKQITDSKTLIAFVDEVGFLPFFKNAIEGFSLEELTPTELWFQDGVEGPWEWKDIIARSGQCIYGKFFDGRAGYVSIEKFPHFANYRRDGYDFDARFDEGIADSRDKSIMDALETYGDALSKELKRICGFTEGAKGFETCITRLQMQTYILPVSFEKTIFKNGDEHGWGVARYTITEKRFGELARSEYSTSPDESLRIILDYLSSLLPKATPNDIFKLIKRVK